MNVLEKEIEDMIWQGINENRPLLRKKGLWVWDKTTYHRQIDFGSYGICDIIGIQVEPKRHGFRHINVHVIEIKKEEVNNATFYQALRYCKAAKRVVAKRLTNTTVDCGITLVGKTVDCKSDFIYLPDLFDNVALYTYKLDFKRGITFKREHGYSLTDEKIPSLDELKKAAIATIGFKIRNVEMDDLPF